MANSSSSSIFTDFGGNTTFTNQTTGFGPSSNVTSSSNTTTVQWDPTQFDWAAIYNMQVQSKRVCLAFFVWVIYDYLLTIDDSKYFSRLPPLQYVLLLARLYSQAAHKDFLT
ncbi:hypothetical protein FRC18_007828 [Serendipita sp. 400]|nr:hypothetical protein FRC18_007828 [Serendipita sp. 400]